MSLKENIQTDLTTSIKEKKEVELSVLRQLFAAFLNKEKEKRFSSKEEKDAQLTEEEVQEVVAAEAKKRKEAIEGFEKGGRKESAEKEKKELEILKKYLPEQMAEEELKKLVQEAIEKVGAQELKDMGKIMAELMPKIKGRADGNQVSQIVKELLIPQDE